MKECEKCHTEYDGESCPNCQQVDDKKVTTNNENKTFKDKICGFVDKYYAKLKLVPPLTFLAYMVLSALFLFVCPVAVVKVAGVKYGSVFSGKLFNEIPGLNNVAIVLRIVAIISIIFTLIYVLYRFVTFKYARIGKVRVSFIFEILSAVFVFVLFVLDCIVAGVINTADKGIDLVLVGSYSILGIILSIFALMLIISTTVACYLYEKQHPELEVEFDKNYEIAKEKAKNRKKKEISTRQKISGVVAGIICIICIFICLGDAGVFSFDKSFNAKTLRSMILADNGELNITKTGLVKKFGDAYVSINTEEDADSRYSTYYTSNYVKLKRKQERFSKYSEKASLEKMIEWASYEYQLMTDEANMTYGEASITFNKYQGVEQIIYTVHSPKSSSKKLIDTKVMKVVETNPDNDGIKEIDYIVFMATYSDGSFVYAKCNTVGVKLINNDYYTFDGYKGSYTDYELGWSFGSENYSYGTTTSTYHTNHTASTAWVSDDTHHWNPCSVSDDCTEKFNYAEHDSDGSCSTCGKE